MPSSSSQSQPFVILIYAVIDTEAILNLRVSRNSLCLEAKLECTRADHIGYPSIILHGSCIYCLIYEYLLRSEACDVGAARTSSRRQAQEENQDRPTHLCHHQRLAFSCVLSNPRLKVLNTCLSPNKVQVGVPRFDEHLLHSVGIMSYGLGQPCI